MKLMEETLNECGEKGWELVWGEYITLYAKDKLIVYLKRKKQ